MTGPIIQCSPLATTTPTQRTRTHDMRGRNLQQQLDNTQPGTAEHARIARDVAEHAQRDPHAFVESQQVTEQHRQELHP